MAQSRNPTIKGGFQALRPSHSTTSTLTYTGTHAVMGAACAASVIRIIATTDCYVAIGSAPVADSGDMYVRAFIPEYFRVIPGSDKVSAVQVSAGGSCYVTEMD